MTVARETLPTPGASSGDVDTAAIRARHAATTPGQWIYTPGIGFKHYLHSENHDLEISLQEMHPLDGRDVPAGENLAFIAAAHNTDIPALCDAVDAQALEIARLHAALTTAQLPHDGECPTHWGSARRNCACRIGPHNARIAAALGTEE